MKHTLVSQVIKMREWSRVDPSNTPALRGLQLSAADKLVLSQLAARTSLRVEEHRQGLSVRVGSHVGVVPLAGVQLVIQPKLSIGSLMRVIAYAFDLGELGAGAPVGLQIEEGGDDFLDMLGVMYLREVEKIKRRGVLVGYVDEEAVLESPRGRLDVRDWGVKPEAVRRGVRCWYQVLSRDQLLNRVLIGGLRWLARRVKGAVLAGKLRRATVGLGESHARLTKELLADAAQVLDRRSAHYRGALQLLALLFQTDAMPSPSLEGGPVAFGGFLLDMNLVFERFLARYLGAHAPRNIAVQSQQSMGEIFTYLSNPAGWQQPKIRPDFVISGAHGVVAVADAKYKDRSEHPPNTQELYQLTTYGLSIALPVPRTVLLLHPLGEGEADRSVVLRFAPPQQPESVVEIRLVGVPLGKLVSGDKGWWPLPLSVPWRS